MALFVPVYLTLGFIVHHCMQIDFDAPQYHPAALEAEWEGWLEATDSRIALVAVVRLVYAVQAMEREGRGQACVRISSASPRCHHFDLPKMVRGGGAVVTEGQHLCGERGMHIVG
jgi:hypothetical protein